MIIILHNISKLIKITRDSGKLDDSREFRDYSHYTSFSKGKHITVIWDEFGKGLLIESDLSFKQGKVLAYVDLSLELNLRGLMWYENHNNLEEPQKEFIITLMLEYVDNYKKIIDTFDFSDD